MNHSNYALKSQLCLPQALPSAPQDPSAWSQIGGAVVLVGLGLSLLALVSTFQSC